METIDVIWFEKNGIYHATFDGRVLEANSRQDMVDEVKEILEAEYGKKVHMKITQRVPPKD